MNKDLLNSILAGLLVLAIGIFSGYSLGYYRGAQSRFPEIRTVADINPGVATLKLDGIKDGKLKGSVTGREIRIVVAPQDIRTFAVGAGVEIPIGSAISSPTAASAIPADAQFVASRRGKLYYSIFDPRALGLSPENLIYFRSAEEAEKGGYRKAVTTP
jgi:hypothetical protein